MTAPAFPVGADRAAVMIMLLGEEEAARLAHQAVRLAFDRDLDPIAPSRSR